MSFYSSHGMEETGRILGKCWTHQPWNWSNLLSDRSKSWQKLCQEENSCHHVTCVQGGSGSKGTNQKGRTLSDPSSLLHTPCCHHLELFAHQVTSPKFLAAHQSSTAFLSCGKSLPHHWPCQWVQPAQRRSLWGLGGVQRSEHSCPVQEWSFFIFMSKLRSLSCCLNAEAVA